MWSVYPNDAYFEIRLDVFRDVNIRRRFGSKQPGSGDDLLFDVPQGRKLWFCQPFGNLPMTLISPEHLDISYYFNMILENVFRSGR